MATFHGPLPITGKLNGLVFYKSGDKFKVRMAPKVDKEKFKNSPTYERFRRHMNDFSTVAKGNKLLRSTLSKALPFIHQKEIQSRLTRELVRVIQTDQVNVAGGRTLNNGDFSTLRGFEFNPNCSLRCQFCGTMITGIDNREGRLWLEIPAFNPSLMVSKVLNATHFKLVSVALEIDFETGRVEELQNQSAFISLDDSECPKILLSNKFEPDPIGVLFLATGIIYFECINGQYVPLKTGAALQIAEACNE